MASPSIKKLGQAMPAATTDVTLYTCPATRRAVVSVCTVQETGNAVATFRVCHTTGSTTTAGTALYWNSDLTAKQHAGLCEGWTLAAGDSIVVQASTAAVTFTLMGEESDVPA